MPKEEYVRARTDAHLKQHAEAIFSRLGLSMTDAINMFLVQVTMHDGLPFEVRIAANDAEYQHTKDFLFEERKRQLRAAIAEGEADFEAGHFLTMEESRARTRAKIESLQAERDK